MRYNVAYREMIIKKCIKGKYTNKKAANMLDLSVRQIKRLKKRLLANNSIAHGNCGKEPTNKISKEKETEILNLYNSKYLNFNFRHFIDCLEEYEEISVSYNLVYRILTTNDIKSPKHHKRSSNDSIHPLRERRKHFGELVQIDASIHNWFGSDVDKATLHGAIDDASGKILALYFDHNESLNGYYNMLYIILTKYGIPEALYGDNRTIFEYQRKKYIEEDNTHIHFKRCCSELGIELITTSVSQAKGRIERLWNTLQSRLVAELELNGINNIDSANKFLPSFIERYNAKFSVEPFDEESYFVPAPSLDDINLYLSIILDRKILDGSMFKYRNHRYQCIDSNNKLVKLATGESIKVIETFDHKLLVEHKGEILDCKEIQFKPKETIYIKKGRTYLPASPNNPWRRFVINPKNK